jgi:HAMP domain-containing protein
MASLAVMLHYSRMAVKVESMENAMQTLDGVMMRIDNILLSVEQSTGNIFFSLMEDLDHPDKMFTYSRKVIETNPYVVGCAIAFKEDFYKDHKYFLAYAFRTDGDSLTSGNSPIVRANSYGSKPYTEQVWFKGPMASGKPEWLNPLVGMSDSTLEPIITFSLPLYGKEEKPVGVIAVDVSLSLLSTIVAETKVSANSYCALLDRDGTFIVHPNGNKLIRQTAFVLSGRESDSSVMETVKSMVSGETDYRSFRLNDADFYIFYKPFKRLAVPGHSVEELGWSAGIIYPANDIYGQYNRLFYYVIFMAVVGLLLLFVLCRVVIHRQLLPLRVLAAKAQSIAQGHYDESLTPSTSSPHSLARKDEIGRLQSNFTQMQQSLAANIGELEQLLATFQERGEVLRAAYNQAQKADRMKTAFLHNMTNQMLAPAEAIDEDVNALCKGGQMSQALVDDIQKQGNTIADLLNSLIKMSDDERKRKEDAHD